MVTIVLGMYPGFGDPFEQGPREGRVSLSEPGALTTSLEVLHTPGQPGAVVEPLI